jgi:hypothetical protein
MAVLFSREWLNSRPWYLDLRWSLREGMGSASRRWLIQRKILKTPPIRTDFSGPAEIRVLTWRRDCLNLLWALKSFYHFAGVKYPLYIHDGGLLPSNLAILRHHFPDATIVAREEADSRVTEILQTRNLERCISYRRRNVATRKLFDFFLLSNADYVISIDSDIVFFKRPAELCKPPAEFTKNYYNKDESYWYSLTAAELSSSFGIVPPGLINSGLFVVRRESIDCDAIEEWLANPKLFADTWVGEQTLHALCSSVYGVELLPDSYRVSTKAGLSPDLVCKHYPGFFRPLLYREGMAHLVERGFLRALGADGSMTEPTGIGR